MCLQKTTDITRDKEKLEKLERKLQEVIFFIVIEIKNLACCIIYMENCYFFLEGVCEDV